MCFVSLWENDPVPLEIWAGVSVEQLFDGCVTVRMFPNRRRVDLALPWAPSDLSHRRREWSLMAELTWPLRGCDLLL